ncbi:LOW QUALITY PROTEIN: large ribosomal subunit protein mL52-like, partial [Chelonoidis abingdonii]|uniref:LOW QUALITY PROTEIN: large ribosomal subunit protein mL52-like n=1 Tax=Chelonoidis abingdonii TaxID=106734 RepID=UPI0013F265B2
QQGLDPSLEGYECLGDLPDWSFVDRCPTPSGKGQIHCKQDNEAFVRWVAMLSQDMDRWLQKCEVQQHKKQEATETKRQNQLQPSIN